MISRERNRTGARQVLVVAVAALSTLTACGGGTGQAEPTGTVTGHLMSLVGPGLDAGPRSLSGTLSASNQSGHVVAVVKVPASGKFSLRLPAGSYGLSAVLDGSKQSCRSGNPPWAKVKAGATTVANVDCGYVS